MIVAILGGGYYTYKSFAASVTWTWEPGGTAVDIKKSGSCSNSIYKEPSKNNKQVWNIACPNNGSSAFIFGKSLLTLGPGSYRTCSMIKGGGLVSPGIVDNTEKPIVFSVPAFNINNDGAYHEYCSPTIQLSQKKSVKPLIMIIAGSWVSISYMQLQKL